MRKINSIFKISLFVVFLSFSLFINNVYAAASDTPTILPRSEWTKKDPSLEKLLTWLPDKSRNNPPDYYPVERVVIHYTETSNFDNTKEVSIARIQAIYQYHAVTKGWGDIGYNYIIDRLGNIYEGRYGGNSVRAAHAFNSVTRDNYNVGTIGIALLGNYSSEDPPEAMFTSLKKLTGWLAAANGFDPNTSKNSDIWNEKQNGFTTHVNLPRVISHKDIDLTNDSGIPAGKFNEFRTQSQSFYNEYKNNIYKVGETLYEIVDGDKIIVFRTDGKNIVTISQTQLDIFPLLSVGRHPNSTLIKTNNSGIAFLENNYKRPIINPEVFNSRFQWSQVVSISSSEWDGYPEGLPITLRDGTLVRANGENDIYVISNGGRRWISGPALFETLGYKWNDVRVISSQTLTLHSLGDPVTDILSHPDGTLVTAPGEGVALVSGGKRRSIPTPEIFQAQYSWKDIISIASEEWNRYQEGDPVYYPDGMLFREKDDSRVYVVENGQKRWITSPILFSTLGYKWDNIILISSGAAGGMVSGENISGEILGLANR